MKHLLRLTFAAFLAAIAGAGPGGAVEPDEMLDDPALEERARDISAGLRCLVCQNQSIDDSNADLARDLRVIVRQRLEAGDSDDQVLQYVVDRYGDYVLLNPPVKPATYLLWYGPAAILLIAMITLAMAARRRRAAPGDARLSEDEHERLAKLMQEEGQSRENR